MLNALSYMRVFIAWNYGLLNKNYSILQRYKENHIPFSDYILLLLGRTIWEQQLCVCVSSYIVTYSHILFIHYTVVYLFLIEDMSCPPRTSKHICAIEGSSPILAFTFDGSVMYSPPTEGSFLDSKFQIFNNFTAHIDLHIYNVTPSDEGYYQWSLLDWINLKVASK